jgi:hypothetical protein
VVGKIGVTSAAAVLAVPAGDDGGWARGVTFDEAEPEHPAAIKALIPTSTAARRDDLEACSTREHTNGP